jgi:hypothetical protein
MSLQDPESFLMHSKMLKSFHTAPVSSSFPAMAWTKILYRYWNLKTAITP